MSMVYVGLLSIYGDCLFMTMGYLWLGYIYDYCIFIDRVYLGPLLFYG